MTTDSFQSIDYRQLKQKVVFTENFARYSRVFTILIASLFIVLTVFTTSFDIFNISTATRLNLLKYAFIFVLIVGTSAYVYGHINLKKHLKILARDHNLLFLDSSSANTSKTDGILFGLGDRRVKRYVLTGQLNGRTASYYTYNFDTGRRSGTARWQVLSIEIKQNLPDLLLDSLDNNIGYLTNLPVSPRSSTEITLEGDFHRYYKLYSSAANTSVPLEIITPDVMQKLIDIQGRYDIEITGGVLHIFTADATYVEAMEQSTTIARQLLESLKSNVGHFTPSESKLEMNSNAPLSSPVFGWIKTPKGMFLIITILLIASWIVSIYI